MITRIESMVLTSQQQDAVELLEKLANDDPENSYVFGEALELIKTLDQKLRDQQTRALKHKKKGERV